MRLGAQESKLIQLAKDRHFDIYDHLQPFREFSKRVLPQPRSVSISRHDLEKLAVSAQRTMEHEFYKLYQDHSQEYVVEKFEDWYSRIRKRNQVLVMGIAPEQSNSIQVLKRRFPNIQMIDYYDDLINTLKQFG